VPLPALLLAGRRAAIDPVARAQGVSHRALVPIGGVSMLARVARTLLDTPDVTEIRVSVEDASVLDRVAELAAPRAAGRITHHTSAGSPAASVADALSALAPDALILVTTADHPLLTPSMVTHFVASALALDVDVAVGVVAASIVRAAHPDSQRTFVRLRGEAWTGANLFLLRAAGAARAAAFWQRVEPDRKRPLRLMRHFGLGTLARFALRRLDLTAATARVSRAVAARVAGVPLPFAEAAIDVDRAADLALATRLLEAREAAAARHGSA
jgi:CMP-2-keto-3-deoxyoctulosonic acid synthetase